MEQRTDDRKAVSFDAVVGCPRFGLIRGRIVDLGLGGLYIRAETSIVPIGARVSVTFQPGEDICGDCLSIMRICCASAGLERLGGLLNDWVGDHFASHLPESNKAIHGRRKTDGEYAVVAGGTRRRPPRR